MNEEEWSLGHYMLHLELGGTYKISWYKQLLQYLVKPSPVLLSVLHTASSGGSRDALRY